MENNSQILHIKMLEEQKQSGFSCSWHDPNNLDTKRHYKMLDNIIPIIDAFGKDNKWLTMGDHFGREAIYLKRKNIKHVICSSLKHQFGNEILNYAGTKSENNFDNVNEVKNIDVEKLSFSSYNVDFVLCKESFHHFPRPMLGLYKMLESAKKAVILLEPQEKMEFVESFGFCKIENEDKISNCYEKVGNFKYEVSVREICKSAWSLYLPHVIVKGFNDPYADFYTKDGKSHNEKWDKYKNDLKCLNLMGETNKRMFNLISCVILKNKLSENEREILLKGNYKIYDRPINKHIEDKL